MSRFEDLIEQAEIDRQVRRERHRRAMERIRFYAGITSIFCGQIALIVVVASLHPGWPW